MFYSGNYNLLLVIEKYQFFFESVLNQYDHQFLKSINFTDGYLRIFWKLKNNIGFSSQIFFVKFLKTKFLIDDEILKFLNRSHFIQCLIKV